MKLLEGVELDKRTLKDILSREFATCNSCEHSCRLCEYEIGDDQEGWEYPECKVLICPICGGTDISI